MTRFEEAMTEAWRMAKKRLEIEVKNTLWHVSTVKKTQHKVPKTDGCIPKTKASGRDVSREIHEWESSLKEKSHTWNKSCKDSAKREGDILKLVEVAATDEKQEAEARHNIHKLLKRLRKERKVEDEAPTLLEEVQKNLEEAQARGSAMEQKIFGRFDEYMWTWTDDRGRLVSQGGLILSCVRD